MFRYSVTAIIYVPSSSRCAVIRILPCIGNTCGFLFTYVGRGHFVYDGWRPRACVVCMIPSVQRPSVHALMCFYGTRLSQGFQISTWNALHAGRCLPSPHSGCPTFLPVPDPRTPGGLLSALGIPPLSTKCKYQTVPLGSGSTCASASISLVPFGQALGRWTDVAFLPVLVTTVRQHSITLRSSR